MGSEAKKLEDNAHLMDRYSRQIGAYGIEAMSKLLNLKVLIVGLRGVGVETAKNLILAGPGAVTLHDDEPVALRDLGANFFLTPHDVGKPRAPAVQQKLQELNSMVTVRAHTGALTEAVVAAHTCVVWCNGTAEDLVRWDSFCHARKAIFIATGTLGAFGYVFSDFGPAFTVRDVTGEAPVTRIVTDVTNDATRPIVTLLGAAGEEGGRMHGLDENEHDGWVELSDVEGMDGVGDGAGKTKGIDDLGPVRIRHCTKKARVTKEVDGKKVTEEKTVFDPYRLAIEADTSAMTEYLNGGVLTQVKVPVTKHHRPLSETLRQPVAPGEYGLLFTDGAKFGRAEQLHLTLLALWDFQASHGGRLPAVGVAADAAAVAAAAAAINARHQEANAAAAAAAADKDSSSTSAALALDEVDVTTVTAVAGAAAAELQPLCAYFGGVVAQEVVKATGKYLPLNQWLHLDFLEVLPAERPTDAGAKGTRYDHLLEVYGEAFLRDKLMAGKTFMVGCGALGCEFLKNFALLGFGCGPGGRVTVTDNDRIEVSNLSRQFLFRESNVGQPKSSAAAAAVRHMNKDIHVDAREALVAPQTESLFPDEFWEGLDVVTNALDNVKARLYVDSRCVFYGKPLLESGTLGTKCNVQVVVPHVTASYADGPKDQEDEDNIPMCTLRNFPSLTEHCIEWARAQFADLFVAPFAEAKKFAADKDGYLQQVRASTLDNPNRSKAASAIVKAVEDLSQLRRLLEQARAVTFEACIAEAVTRFHELFRDRILQLAHNFPEDHTNDAGERFWTGAKRFPQSAILDVADETHVSFVLSAANILAAAYGLVPPPEREPLPADHRYRDPAATAAVAGALDVPMWEPTNEKIDLEEGKENGQPAAGEAGAAGGAASDGAAADGTTESNGDSDAMDVGDAAAELSQLLEALSEVDVTGLCPEPAEFEKDQDANYHIDFVTAASNMRAWNYRIRAAPRHKVKMIAGKIIPALATTTASVCGLVMVELLKVLQKKPLEAYKDSSNNLGLNSYFFSEPAPPEKAKDEYDPINMAEVRCLPPGFTKWDKTVVDSGDLTLAQFLAAFHEVTGLKCTLLFHAVSELDGPQRGLMLYDAEAWNPKLKALYASKMDASLREWAAERYAEAPVQIMMPTRKYVELQVMCATDDDEPCRVPTVVYRWAR